VVAGADGRAGLDPAERERLLDRAAHGDRDARDALCRAHLDLVRSAIADRAGQGLSSGDLFQEGAIGLVQAITSFGGSGETDFESYARRQVAHHMDTALEEEAATVRDGERLVRAAEDYERVQVELRRKLGRPATNAELAEKLEWSTERAAQIGRMVEDAHRRHDEEILQYLDPMDGEGPKEDEGEPPEA
jgi:RNA polymerase sigma factor (sigma-70 family)